MGPSTPDPFPGSHCRSIEWHTAQEDLVSSTPESQQPGVEDWRARTRSSKGGSALVLLLTLALVLGGAWLLESRKKGDDGATSGGSAAAASVELSGDQTGSAPEIGQPAPDFTAVTMDGKKVKLSELRGHPVWITFGATWCRSPAWTRGVPALPNGAYDAA